MTVVSELTEAITAGRTFDEIFEIAFDRLRAFVPYNRLGVALASEAEDRLRLVAVRSDGPVELESGYVAKLRGSSLEDLLRSGQPRILNDLEAYLRQKPASDSTRRIVHEGMRSSLTLPLLVKGRAVGAMFFSSRQPNTYTSDHNGFLRLVSGHIAISVERSRLLEEIDEQRTDLARTCEELKKNQEALIQSRSLAAVGELAATVAHEIKNPLAGISGAIQVLRDSFGEADSRREVVQEVLEQVKRLDDTVRDLLIFARPWTPAVTPFDLQELAGRVVSAARKAPAAGGIVFKIESTGSTRVTADPQLLENLLVNLIQNAVDATPSGGTIALRILPHATDVEVVVADTGNGIPEEVRERLFRPFVSTKARGTGLGLAISKKIVEGHGGTIRVDSACGRGTEVRFTLPSQPIGGSR